MSALCRICLDDDGDEPLISPCLCRGTVSHVHFHCLRSYYESLRDWPRLHCTTCQHPYEAGVAVQLGELGLQRAEQEYGADAPAVSAVLNALGNAYAELGDCQTKCDLLHRALNIDLRRFGPSLPLIDWMSYLITNWIYHI